MSTPTPVSDSSSRNAARRRGIALVGAVVVVGAMAGGAYWTFDGRFHESTSDAYVDGNVVQITPQVAGTVVAIGADDTQFVSAGQELVRLDPADTRIALDQAEAKLATTVREVRTQFATSAELAANVARREADLAMANEDLARRERLGSSGAISGEELQHARDLARAAQAELAAARQQLAAQRARIDGTSIEAHPDVLAASAAVRAAFLNDSRTRLPSPVSGYVAHRSVQLGQRVAPGAPLMAVVPLDQVWVDANFKEAEMANMRVGQPVELTADLYGRSVRYHGTVAGFGAGTGAAFSLLPAQNATGNWIKIVQRVPVRIALDPRELAAHPLQIGLSMTARVDTRDRGGPRLPRLAKAAAVYQTDVFDTVDERADQRVHDIIAANASGTEARPRGESAARLAHTDSVSTPSGL